ncbi:hypothetical protein [uncultured Aquimarina sp.]|uniref:hypothetical protein n=1 Tax=uncultured Aquimarina sp. TaxID=575652 RepID=UPI0026291AEB|nr:hypothetical protein [uncultured Aquimarina sp.]
MKKYILSKEYITLLPFLVAYVLIVIFKQQNILVGDEGRFWSYAAKLLKGYYADNEFGEYSYLWNGPGYPIVLMPFRYLETSLLYPKLMNAFFLYSGLIFFFRSLKHFISRKKSLLVTCVLGLYYPLLLMALPTLMTEALSFLCCTAFICFYLSYHRYRKTWQLLLCAFFLGYLAITKVIFGYVIVTVLVILLILYLFSKAKKTLVASIKILICSLVICSPYLIYTYSLTDKFFYWGNSGGMNLYWMSSPYDGELGDWYFFENLEESQPEVYENHKEYLASIEDLDPVEKDAALKQKGVENILDHKEKFVRNWISNVSRIFIELPYSYRVQSNNQLFYLFPNGILIVFLCMAIFLSVCNYKLLPTRVVFLLLIAIVYLGGVSLLSAYVRFLYPILPLLLIWICYTFENYIKISRSDEGTLMIVIKKSNFLSK